jgi:hypothetical protein
MVVEVRPPGEGRVLRLEDGNKVRVVESLNTAHRIELHAITPRGTVVVELTDEEVCHLAVALLRERSLMLHGGG